MTATSTLHSNALNFLSHVQNGVDSRTGLYTLAVDLPALSGNDLLGPDLDLILRYSPLNMHDSGYGKGWNLQLTEFDPSRERRIISLASGETFKSTGRVGSTNQLAMQEKKIDTFHLYEESDSRWRVVHRSGQVEILEPQGESDKRRAMPVQIFNEQGQWLKLEYTTFRDFPRLTKVTDMRGDTLLSIGRESDRVTLTFPTDVGDATYALVLADTDNRVARIELPTDNLASWRFTYDRIRTIDCISRVRTPTGGFEEVFYQDNGHLFPDRAGRALLPRVTRHVVHPGHGQPSIDTRYTYSANGHNFLGGNAQLDWYDDGLDNLFRQVMEYDYETTETLWVDDKPVRSIQRNFNKFHLLTSETTCHGSQLSDDGKAVVGPYIKENVTTYKLTAGRRFDEQPNYCQLPHGVVTRWYLKNNATRNRSERVETVYDDYGNITKHTSNDGVVETSTWYKQAEEGYPGNAERFVRHLKSKTITPASGHSGTALALTTHYRYQRLPVLASSVSDSSQEHWLALERETLESESDDPLKTVCYSYHAIAQEVPALDRPMHHGRLQSRTLQFPNPQANKNNGVPCTLDTKTTHRYSYLTQDWTTLRASGLSAMSAVPTLKVEQETEGFDGTSETTAQGFSRLTGEPVLDIDQDQVERMTAYDSLRRVILEVVAPATDSEAVRSTAHYLCATEGDQARQCLTDPQQVVTQTVYDGLGRVRTQSRNHVHPEQLDRLFPIHERSHDAWGREVSETESDWLDGLAFPDAGQSRTQAYRYDAWGERAIVIRHDGVQEHLSFDPTEKDAHNHVHKTRWLQAGGQTLKSEKVSTWSNAFDKPVRIERLDLSDKIVASQAFSYDGLGRCTSSTDERLNVTKFEYDAFGRMTVNLLPDDTRIEYEYAAHAEEEWRTCIKACPVNEAEAPWTVGTQTFDGLGRLASRKTGERLEQYMYQPGQSMPQSRLTGAGDAIQYDYNLALTTLPIKSTAHDDQAVFEYDPVTALPLKVGNDHGNRLFDYNRHEQLTEEHWVTHEGKLQTTHYTRSILGRLKTRRDAGGMSAEHTYDARGRLESLTEGNLHASLVYDSLGRLCQVTSTDQANGSTLQTDVEHDEHGREHKRIQLLDGGTCRTLVQHWGKDGLLDQRTLQVGDKTQREELFSYDRRGRLTKVEYSGTHLPVDDADRQMTRQIFRFDFLDNITHCLTSFIDGSTETAHYEHDPQERCQLSKLTLSRAGEEQRVLSFSHDANGNLMIDEQGRALQYDQQNRLLEITGNSRYRYDGAGQLLTSAVGTEPERMLWFEGDRLKLAVQGAIQTRYTFLDDMPLAQQSDDPAATLLLLTDASHSVIAESQAGILREATYTAHGQRHASPPLNSHLGFTGEALEPDSDWYLLGRGYRAYSPVLRRFNSPDSESPFDAGGLNPYAYCLGNPVTLRDPTGHQAQGGSGRPRRPDEDDPHWRGRTNADSGAMQWVWLGVAVVATIASVVTAGASLAAVGAFGAGAMAAVNAAGAAVAAGQGVGITTAFLSTFAGTGAVAAAVSTTTAVLAVAGTTAQAVATIGNDATAGKVAEYLGLGAAAIGGLTFGFGIVRSVVNAVRQGAEQVSRTGVVSAVGASAAVPVERTASAARQHSQSRGQQVMEGTSSAQPDLVKNRFRTNVPKLRTLGQISRTQYRFRMGR